MGNAKNGKPNYMIPVKMPCVWLKSVPPYKVIHICALAKGPVSVFSAVSDKGSALVL